MHTISKPKPQVPLSQWQVWCLIVFVSREQVLAPSAGPGTQPLCWDLFCVGDMQRAADLDVELALFLLESAVMCVFLERSWMLHIRP